MSSDVSAIFYRVFDLLDMMLNLHISWY